MTADLSAAFRIDASREIGMGHFMRCLTLADALRQRGAQTRFVCRILPEFLQDMLGKHHHELRMLDYSKSSEQEDDLAHSHFLPANQQQDAMATLEAVSNQSWDWFIVDHYAIDKRHETVLRKSASKIMVIDDIADRDHDCDLLLDQNLYSNMEERYVGRVPKHCRLLLGPGYALLRDEFRKLREKIKPGNGNVARVLVFLGGFDPCNLTGPAIRALNQVANDSLSVDVVIGAQHPNRSELEESCRVHRYHCHVQPNRVAELMAQADLAIGAGGSTSWERCCLGLPTVAVAFADNQIDIAANLDKVGACIFLGDQKTATQAEFEQLLTQLFMDSDRLSVISLAAYSLVDGCGTQRVCDLIFE